MSLTVLCASAGINTGTPDCAPVPGVGKYLLVWGGKLTPAQLLSGYNTCKASLVGNSKLSKLNSNKLMVFPIIRELTNKKESNTEAKLADGFSQVTREGLPAYEFKIKSDMYLVPVLRQLNNKRIKYLIVDDQNLLLGTQDVSGNFIGRAGRLFTDGIDVHGYTMVNGQTMIQLNAENAFETFDNAACIQLDKSPDMLFSSLRDIQLYPVASLTTVAASNGVTSKANVTISAIGSVNDTFNISQSGVSITNGAVAQTSSESTPALLAQKIVTAINGFTSTSGYSATISNAVITVVGTIGTALNGSSISPVVFGAITFTTTAFSGGLAPTVSGNVIHVSGKMQTPNPNVPLDFFSDYSSSALGSLVALYSVTAASTGVVYVPTQVVANPTGYFDLYMGVLPSDSYTVNLVAPDVLDANLVLSIEATPYIFVKP